MAVNLVVVVPQLLFDDNECQLFQTGYIVI